MESEPGLNAPATKADIVGILAEFRKGLATKEDLERFGTKEDLERFATKEDLERFATKQDLERFAEKTDSEFRSIRQDLGRFATKDDLRGFRDELKNDIARVWTGLSDLKRDLSAQDEQTRAEFAHWRARTDRRLRRLETRGR